MQKKETSTSDSVQQHILDAADHLFSQYGLRAVSVDDVCRKVGISKKTFYAYYPTKEQLVDEVIDFAIGQVSARFKREAEGLNVVEVYVASIKKADEWSSTQTSGSFRHEVEKYYPRLYAQKHKKLHDMRRKGLVGYLRQGIEEGFFHADLIPELFVIYFESILDVLAGLFEERNVNIKGRRVSRKMLAEDAIRMFSRLALSPKGVEMLERIVETKKK